MAVQTFSKNFIFERIKDSKYPFWSLYLNQGFQNRSNVQQFFGGNFAEDDSDETKIEKSIKALQNTLSTFDDSAVFIIELKNAKTANGNGIIGPFQFQNAETVKKDSEQAAPGLGAIPAGYVPESMLKGIEDKINAEFNAKLERYKAESERREREAEFKRREEQLAEREKELKEQEKSYNSSVAKTADIFITIGQKLAAHFFPATDDGAAAQMVVQQQQLGQPQTPQLNDEKMQAVDELSEYMYKNFDTDKIKAFKEILMQEQKNELERQNNGSNAATADGGAEGSN